MIAVTTLGLARPAQRPRRVALGVFDGVHLGHQAVIAGADTVVTFDPHPLAVLAPRRAPRLIDDVQTRARRLAVLGVRELVLVPFDPGWATCSATRFVDAVLVDALGTTHLSVGEGFRFGAGGAGDVRLLRADDRFTTRVVPLVHVDGVVVSSSEIRRRLAAGDHEGAARMLGGPGGERREDRPRLRRPGQGSARRPAGSPARG